MAAQCVTKVELTVSCDNLLDKDIGSKSDPLCVLLMSSSDSDQWYEVRHRKSQYRTREHWRALTSAKQLVPTHRIYS